jgi:hypothetical protein
MVYIERTGEFLVGCAPPFSAAAVRATFRAEQIGIDQTVDGRVPGKFVESYTLERQASHGSVFWKRALRTLAFGQLWKQVFVPTRSRRPCQARLLFASNCRHFLPLLARQTRGDVTEADPTLSQCSKCRCPPQFAVTAWISLPGASFFKAGELRKHE